MKTDGNSGSKPGSKHAAAQGPLSADDPRLTAYALGELDGAEHAGDRAAVEALLARDETARAEVERLRELADELVRELAAESEAEAAGIALRPEQRAAVEAAATRGTATRRTPLRAARVFWPVLAASLLAAAVWWFDDGVTHRPVPARDGATSPFAYELFSPDPGALVRLRTLGYGGAAADSSQLVQLGYSSGGYCFPPQPSRETESYAPIVEPDFLLSRDAPLSTFAVDVDSASYSNVRRFLNQGRLPPPDAVRLEELVNAFRYDYAQPVGEHPFSVSAAVADCPWAPQHRLVRIGLAGREIPPAERPATNLVFLVDVSGSMNSPNKLPLVVASLRMLVSQLDERDRIAIVTYAGSAGVVLPSTSASEKRVILAALDGLSAGGSTAGAAGIQLAYETATANFIQGGSNRVILASDGDFNVGARSHAELQALIERSAKSGVFLTVLGFGTGNLKDDTAELLANKGNGHYAYIDTLDEGRRVLVEQIGGTLFTIAKDVKIQVEFNPARVAAYRLLGYENRALAARDFNDDRKDAGEIGAGHRVTALYEIVPVGVSLPPSVDPLRYQAPAAESVAPQAELVDSPELLHLKLRYKQPDGDTSVLIEQPLVDAGHTLEQADPELRFASAVALFGMLLRGSGHAGEGGWEQVITLAESARGEDREGYRAEFIRLVRIAAELSGGAVGPR